MIEMEQTFGSASEIQIASFEKRNGIRLPDDYRAFLRACNGGEPRSNVFAVPGWNVLVIQCLHGLDTGNRCDLQQRTDALREDELSDFIPIAADAGGQYVFMGVGGPRQGAIYFIDRHDEDAELIKIAESFSDFTTRLALPGAFDDYEYGLPPKKAR